MKRLTTCMRILMVIYLTVVFVLCFGKFSPGDPSQFRLWNIPPDKVVHFLMFLPYPVLAFYAFGGRALPRRRRILAIAGIFVSGVLIALATESIQRLIPYRSGEGADLAADTLGLLLSSLILTPVVCLRD